MQQSETMVAAGRISAALHAELATGREQSLWVAVDAAAGPPGASLSECEERFYAALPGRSSTKVHLRHPQLDPIWYPRWFMLELDVAADSFLLQDSVELALQELLPERLEQGKGRRISGWLCIEGGAEAAAERIGHRMMQRRQGGETRLLRLHDPAVLWAVWPLLSPGQQASWLGPVGAWWLLDPSGKLVSLASRAEPSDEPLTDRQWLAIDNVTALNGALRECLPLNAQRNLDSLRQVAMHALDRARRHGFTDLRDLTLYAKHAMTVHPRFDQHDIVRQLLDHRDAEDHYTALVDALTEQDWLAVQAAAAPA